MKARKRRLRDMGLSAMMAAFLCVLSPITIPAGALPVTLSVFALFLTASLLPFRIAFSATAVYLAVGALGLPVFSSFTGGLFAFVSPSGGFLWGYLPAVFVVSLLCRKSSAVFFAQLLGLLVLYAFGLLGFCVLTDASFSEGVTAVVLPFLLPDALKIAAVLAMHRLLHRRMAEFFAKSS